MRHTVTASRFLEATSPAPRTPTERPIRISWQESLFLATRGGAQALAEPLVGGRLHVGEYLDAQISSSRSLVKAPFHNTDGPLVAHAVELAAEDGVGTGALDFFDSDPETMADSDDWWLEALEKWWCVGSAVNRRAVFVQGRRVR